jgi:hypothetical protein
VTVRTFGGKVLIDIREYYTDQASGEERPGKKGIALSPEQWVSRGVLLEFEREINKWLMFGLCLVRFLGC